MTQIQKKFGRRRMKWTMATIRSRMDHHEKAKKRKDCIAKSHYSTRRTVDWAEFHLMGAAWSFSVMACTYKVVHSGKHSEGMRARVEQIGTIFFCTVPIKSFFSLSC